MTDEKRQQLGIPEIDFSGIRERVESMTEEEMDALYASIMNKPKRDWREFVARIEQHPGALSSWEMPMPFDEFARRVKAGEFDF